VTIQDTAVSVETLHRAVCTRCGYRGELRTDCHPAQADQIKHVTWHRDADTAMARAVRHLGECGFTVLDRNWSEGDYRLPLVADDHGVLVAVDLRVNKERHGSRLDRMSNVRKQVMRRLLTLWMQQHGRRADRIRVDVIGVLGDGTIEHVRAVG
jgi:Holliday junction resolvase-like predicted endonuclease